MVLHKDPQSLSGYLTKKLGYCTGKPNDHKEYCTRAHSLSLGPATGRKALYSTRKPNGHTSLHRRLYNLKYFPALSGSRDDPLEPGVSLAGLLSQDDTWWPPSSQLAKWQSWWIVAITSFRVVIGCDGHRMWWSLDPMAFGGFSSWSLSHINVNKKGTDVKLVWSARMTCNHPLSRQNLRCNYSGLFLQIGQVNGGDIKIVIFSMLKA